MNQIDHLVYATPILQQGMEEIEALTGVKPVIGGRHMQWGTWNALLSLGHNCFFEIISIDPTQMGYEGPSIFELDTIKKSKLVRWVAKSDKIPKQVEQAKTAGFSLGDVINGQREKQDGTQLQWSLTDPIVNPGDGLIPFLIDWKDTPHPGSATPEGCTIVGLSGVHPNAEGILVQLAAIDLGLKIKTGAIPALEVVLKTPKGMVTIT